MAERDDGREEPRGFFSRWSQRKAQVRQGVPAVPEAARPGPLPDAATPVPLQTPAAGAVAATGAAGTSPAAAADAPAASATASTPSVTRAPPPTMQDVAGLTADSDYRAFTGADVDPAVRNAAMKKLFHGDPHFQVMDGLDVYIDDYNTPDPLPKAIMRQMLQARSLGLLDDELQDQDKPAPDAAVRPSNSADTAAAHEDADLQLQPDDAAGPAGPDAASGPAGRPDTA